MKKTLFVKMAMVVLVGTLVFAVYAQDTIAASGTKTLKIGGIAMLTGPASQCGLACKQAWQLAVDKYNDAGGMKIGNDTYTLKLIVEDDQMSPEQGALAATKLINQDKVNIVTGGLIPPVGRAIYEVTSKAGALYALTHGTNVSAALPYPTNMDVAPDKPLLIRCGRTNDEVSPALLDYLVEQYPNVKTIAVNTVAEETAAPLARFIKEEMAKRGLTQVSELEQFAPDIQDYVPLMTRILQSKPDAIFILVGGPIAAGGQLKAARDLGFKGPLFYAINADVDLQAKIAGPDSTDMFGAGLTLADPDSLSQLTKDFKAQYLKKYPERELIADILHYYNGLWVLLQTIEKAQSTDPETIVKTYENLTHLGDIQTTHGSAYVGGLKTAGINRIMCAPSPISRVTDGKSTNVKYVMFDIP
jgi:branched-chain amino acid transport system substrate-binding protein